MAIYNNSTKQFPWQLATLLIDILIHTRLYRLCSYDLLVLLTPCSVIIIKIKESLSEKDVFHPSFWDKQKNPIISLKASHEVFDKIMFRKIMNSEFIYDSIDNFPWNNYLLWSAIPFVIIILYSLHMSTLLIFILSFDTTIIIIIPTHSSTTAVEFEASALFSVIFYWF